MPRYVAYSKHDGAPLPARNRVELDALLAEGHHRSRPEPEGDTPRETPLQTAAEVARAAFADTDLHGPAGDADDQRIRDESDGPDVADDRPGVPLPPATGGRNRGQRSS